MIMIEGEALTSAPTMCLCDRLASGLDACLLYQKIVSGTSGHFGEQFRKVLIWHRENV